MILVIDVGNTNIVFGIYKKDVLVHDWRIASNQTKTSDEYGTLITQILGNAQIKPSMVDDIIISSVVPDLMYTLQNMVMKYFNRRPMIVESGIKTGMNIVYDNPKEVGADRIVNAVAAIHKYGGPLIIIDVGTAITFCVVDGHNNYLGGLILPGIGISSEALFTRTSKLPKVEIVKPGKVIGKTTVTSMQAGLYYGFSTMLDGIIEKILEEMDLSEEETNIIATGGFSGFLFEDSRYNVIINRDLTLDGLRIIYDLNQR